MKNHLPGTAAAQILPADFFQRPAAVVARQLLGKWLVSRVGEVIIEAQINEVEAYVGPHDLACHARVGKTPRNAAMFGPAGQWYVYFIYGMYWMLNIVTGPLDYPAAVLIRGAGGWNGPGKLTRAMNIDRRLDSQPAVPGAGLWLEDRGHRARRGQIVAGPRVGIDYAGLWKDKPLRFVLRERS